MKKILFFALAFSGFTLAATAQTDRTMKPDTNRMKMQQGQDGGMRGQNMQMMKDLNLSDAQKDQMKKNNEEMRTKMQALRDNSTLSEDQRRTQMKAVRDEQKTQMETLLTPDQKVKFDAMRKKMSEQRRQNPNAGNVDPKSADNTNFKNQPQ